MEIFESVSNELKKINRPIKIMHVCGTHENTISRYNLRSLLPHDIKLLAGPGCPVCVCPVQDIDYMIELAYKNYHILTFGDMMRVPSSGLSLQQARSEGLSVSIVMGPEDAVKIAQNNPSEKFIFFSVGFETTAGPIAGTILTYRPKNLFYYLSLRYVPAGLNCLLAGDKLNIDALILPGHASIMSGLSEYEEITGRFMLPSCVSGFGPEDIMSAIRTLCRLIQGKKIALINNYRKVVKASGNEKAIRIISKVFSKKDAYWRGLGILPGTGYVFNRDFEHLDILSIEERSCRDNYKGPEDCICGDIILGKKAPDECVLYGSKCTPASPFGPCMVSFEGTCRNNFQYSYAGSDQ